MSGRTCVVGEMGQPPMVRKLGREGRGWKGGVGSVRCIEALVGIGVDSRVDLISRDI
jgi:hypothetical protein